MSSRVLFIFLSLSLLLLVAQIDAKNKNSNCSRIMFCKRRPCWSWFIRMPASQ